MMNIKFFNNLLKIRREWIDFAIVTMIVFHIILFSLTLNTGEICRHFAGDFCAFWSAGKIINQHGFAAIYDLDLVTQYQKQIFPLGSNPNFVPSAIMYLPIFMIPFSLLTLMPLPLSYFFWILFNFIGIIIYIKYFIKKVTKAKLSTRILLLVLLSLPVIINFYEGQVNLFLGIFLGEFYRALISDKPYKAGIWLSGLLLKPQMLILIIPFLLFQRSTKVLTGFILSSLVILMISFSLINTNGFVNLINIVRKAAEGGVASCPAAMMNWRMLGWLFTSLSSSSYGWLFYLGGSLVTVCATFFVFWKPKLTNPTKTAIPLSGIFVATCLVTWHAHIHMSIVLIPLIVLSVKKSYLHKKSFYFWVLLPNLINFASYFIAAVIYLNNLKFSITNTFLFSRGFAGFFPNLLVLGWAFITYISWEPDVLKSFRKRNI